MINIGDFKTKIIIQNYVIKKNQIKQEKMWANIGTKFCKWINIHGQEVFSNDVNIAKCPATITIRYDKRINNKCRILKDNESYEIISIDNIRDNDKFMEIKIQKVEGG